MYGADEGGEDTSENDLFYTINAILCMDKGIRALTKFYDGDERIKDRMETFETITLPAVNIVFKIMKELISTLPEECRKIPNLIKDEEGLRQWIGLRKGCSEGD